MSAKFSLDGSMIPRTVKRMFDQRAEARPETVAQTAVLTHRDRTHTVELVNRSRSGAMVIFAEVPHIGEKVSVQLAGHGDVSGEVRWVRAGRVGIHFDTPLD